MNFLLKKNFLLIFLVVTVLSSFGLGTWFGKLQIVCPACPPEDVDFSLFWEAWKSLEENYVGKSELNVEEMIYGAVEGMVKSLGDPYTVFLEPRDTEIFLEDVQGSFEGVGMEIDIRNDQLQVVAPLEGTPAQKAGLMAGDKIRAVNGTTTADITIDQAVKMIRGPRGTEVTLTIYRESWAETRDIPIVRGMIEVPSLRWEVKEGNIAYLKLYQFSGKAGSDFNAAAIEILESGADRIILDLRNNPGGYLEISQQIAGWFLERGAVVTIEDFGDDRNEKLYKAEGNGKLLSYPVVVLINQGSASASEILAGALRDNQGIMLVGETSFGKGSVQELQYLRGGSSLKITIARWLTPNGDLIAETGLEPDIEIEMTAEDFEAGLDPQLDKAIEIIQNL